MRVNKTSSKKRIIGPKKKIAFVCSGGATKAGAFHLGVALALKERGFLFRGGLLPPSKSAPPVKPMEISTYVGSSAGSIICSYLASGYTLENIFNSFLERDPIRPEDAIPKKLPRLSYPMMFKLRPEFAKEQLKQVLNSKKIITDIVQGNWESLVEFRWLTTTGLFSTSGLEKHLREEVLPSNQFQDYLSELFVVATQLNHSRKMVFGKYHYQPPAHDPSCEYNNEVSVSQACAASTALPFVFTPYGIDIQRTEGKKREVHFIDGEIRDTLSTHVAIDAGADLVFASHTHQPLHKREGSISDLGLPAILVQSIYLVVEQKINNHIKRRETQRNAINAVEDYCKDQGISKEHQKRICEILEAELHHRREVDTIYIHPSPRDAKMFEREHFSLSPQRMTDIVKAGFKAGIDTLRRYEFTLPTPKIDENNKNT